MPNPAVVDRNALAQVFKDPRTLLAFENLLQTTGGAGVTLSPGDLKPYAGNAAPAGWLECDGSAVSRTAYADLFGIVGVIWGPGDGSTSFNLPDLRGRALLGHDGTHAVGSTGGAAAVVLSVAQLPAHSHAVTDPQHTHVFAGDPHNHAITDPAHSHTESTAVSAATAGAGAGGAAPGSGSTGSSVTGITVNNATVTGTNAAASTGVTIQNTGSGTAVPTQSPYATVMYLIKT